MNKLAFNLPNDLKLGTIIEIKQSRRDNGGTLVAGKEYVVETIRILEAGAQIALCPWESVEDFFTNPESPVNGILTFVEPNYYVMTTLDDYESGPDERPLQSGSDYVIKGNILKDFANFAPIIDGHAGLGKEVNVLFRMSGEETTIPRTINRVSIVKNLDTQEIVPGIGSGRKTWIFDPCVNTPVKPAGQELKRSSSLPQRDVA